MSVINNDFGLKNGGYSNYENTINLGRHRWYYYKEGFSPTLVEKAIEHAGIKQNELIIDPFNGSGTTTLTSSLNGYKSLGIEVNPFTSFLSDAKNKNADLVELEKWKQKIIRAAAKESVSPLIGFSTFSKSGNLEKWLFNDAVLNSFESGWQLADSITSYNIRKLFRLALISAAMQNCNATRDGKCLRYRINWDKNNFDKTTFIEALSAKIDIIKTDIEENPINAKSNVLFGDAREVLKSVELTDKFKLCVTSPPYLNTFDYTDIYRPELFLGKFISTNKQLYDLRLTTVRSHVQAKWSRPTLSDFGILYQQAISHLNSNKESLMDKNIPLMVQAYFEDMFNVLKLLKNKAAKNAQLWLVVSNSAYADKEIPVDLIIGDIGTKAGWFLKEVGVLRYIQRRKTKHSPNVNLLRESVIIFTSERG